MKLTLCVLVATCLATVLAQNPCDRAAQTTFVLGLDNPLSCGLGFQAAEPTPTTPEQVTALNNALDMICTAECAGAVADWLVGPPCNTGDANSTLENILAARFLQLWCQPVENADINRCRFALDAIDPSVLNNTNLQSCAAFPQLQMCPPGCAAGLQSLSQGIGCCYQSIYNNTEIIGALLAAMNITQDEATFFQLLLGNSMLWSACGVDIIDECTGEPFPATATAAVSTTLASTTAPDAANTLTSSIFVIIVGAILSM